jgi:uncharacterized protein YjhX (UPF0386 family)
MYGNVIMKFLTKYNVIHAFKDIGKIVKLTDVERRMLIVRCWRRKKWSAIGQRVKSFSFAR